MRVALVKGIRTFLVGMAGTLTTLVGVDVFTDRRYATTVLVLGIITSVLAGLTSFFQNAKDLLVATTSRGKALVTFFQVAGAGLATIAVTEVTTEAINNLGMALARLAISAVLAGFATLALTASEASAGTSLPSGSG